MAHTHSFDVDVYDKWGPGHWAQAKFRVGGVSIDDVLWTNSPKEAAEFVAERLRRV